MTEEMQMNISPDQLKILVIQVAAEQFGSRTFHRRPLMLAVEQ
jgi:hypothetical protein